MREHYAITDLSLIACDPWSVHLAAPEEYAPLKWRQSLNGADSASATPPRLVQTFLYMREDEEDNHYAHPIPLLPVVDLNADKVVALQVNSWIPMMSCAQHVCSECSFSCIDSASPAVIVAK